MVDTGIWVNRMLNILIVQEYEEFAKDKIIAKMHAGLIPFVAHRLKCFENADTSGDKITVSFGTRAPQPSISIDDDLNAEAVLYIQNTYPNLANIIFINRTIGR